MCPSVLPNGLGYIFPSKYHKIMTQKNGVTKNGIVP